MTDDYGTVVTEVEAGEMRATLANYQPSGNALTALQNASYADEVRSVLGIDKSTYDEALAEMASGRFDASEEIRGLANAVNNILQGNTSDAIATEYGDEAREFMSQVSRADAENFVQQMQYLQSAGEAVLTRDSGRRR